MSKSVSLTKSLAPIQTIAFSTARVNDLDVTVSDVVLGYLAAACEHTMGADGTIGVALVSRLTVEALLVAEYDVRQFVKYARQANSSAFAGMLGEEIGRAVYLERNGVESGVTETFRGRGAALARQAWDLGDAVLCEQANGSVDWF